MSISDPRTWSLVADLDLEPIKFKLIAIGEDYEWSLAKADAVEIDYKRFLYLLIVYPQIIIAPTADIDTFWHAHILDTHKYFRDCDNVANRYIHHFPYLGMRGDDDRLNLENAGLERHRLLSFEFNVVAEGFAEGGSMCSGSGCRGCGQRGIENQDLAEVRPRPLRSAGASKLVLENVIH